MKSSCGSPVWLSHMGTSNQAWCPEECNAWRVTGAESGEWIGGFKTWWGGKPQTSTPGGAGVWDDKGRGLARYLNSFFPSFVHFPLLVLLSQVSHPPGGWVQGSGSSRLITLLTRGKRASP